MGFETLYTSSSGKTAWLSYGNGDGGVRAMALVFAANGQPLNGLIVGESGVVEEVGYPTSPFETAQVAGAIRAFSARAADDGAFTCEACHGLVCDLGVGLLASGIGGALIGQMIGGYGVVAMSLAGPGGIYLAVTVGMVVSTAFWAGGLICDELCNDAMDSCPDCQRDSDCGSRRICRDSACVPGCHDSSTCGACSRCVNSLCEPDESQPGCECGPCRRLNPDTNQCQSCGACEVCRSGVCVLDSDTVDPACIAWEGTIISKYEEIGETYAERMLLSITANRSKRIHVRLEWSQQVRDDRFSCTSHRSGVEERDYTSYLHFLWNPSDPDGFWQKYFHIPGIEKRGFGESIEFRGTDTNCSGLWERNLYLRYIYQGEVGSNIHAIPSGRTFKSAAPHVASGVTSVHEANSKFVDSIEWDLTRI